MKNIPIKIKNYPKVVFCIFLIVVLVLISCFVVRQVKSYAFFNKYDVLTVSGDGLFSNGSIELNGKVIEKNEDEWTHVLPVPNTLEYILLTSSYSKGHDIMCGGKNIAKRVESSNVGENEWCIKKDGKEMIAITSAKYYPYDADNIVYEHCLKDGYYERGGMGYNSCAERALFLNDQQIATTKESVQFDPAVKKNRLVESASFNYYPSKKVGNTIVYSTEEKTYAYDITSKETTTLSEDGKLEDVFQVDGGKIVAVVEHIAKNQNSTAFLGRIDFEGKTYTNVYSAEYVDGHFYILRLASTKEKKDNKTTLGFELLIDDKKVANFEVEEYLSFQSYDVEAVRAFPQCSTSTIVCIYEDGHYAYKEAKTMAEAFGDYKYSDTSTEIMTIDGEWRGSNMPNLIGKSKPIFEDGKLKYIVFTSYLDKGLYLLNINKKWTFNSIFSSNGRAVSKLLTGNQEILNVMPK